MSDALLSPGVGLVFGAASAGTLALCARRVKTTLDDHKVPLMGVLGAFVFAAQMINFTIPGTGSSGHLGGGLLLTILLGKHAAFLTIASVLVIQALLFSDGGLLALGANIFNLGLFPCFIGSHIYSSLSGKKLSPTRITLASTLAAVVVIELGAFGVAGETFLSGRSELPFGSFSALMLGIHFPIALVEGLITAAVVGYLYRLRPEIAGGTLGFPANHIRRRSLTPVLTSLLAAALLSGGVGTWFISSHPDGLEWSIRNLNGREEIPPLEDSLTARLAGLQENTALLPDYKFPGEEKTAASDGGKRPRIHAGTTLSGLVGAMLTLGLAGLSGLVLVRLRSSRRSKKKIYP